MKVVEISREDFIKQLIEEGFEEWGGTDDFDVYGKVTYQQTPALIDEEYWKVYKDHAVKEYSTNRNPIGWSLCEKCGEWYTWDNEGQHESCEYEIVVFTKRRLER